MVGGGENLPEVGDVLDSLSGQVRSLFGAGRDPAEDPAEALPDRAPHRTGTGPAPTEELLVGDWMKLDAQRASGSEDQQAGKFHRASSSRTHGGSEDMTPGPGRAALVRAPGGEQRADPASSWQPGVWRGFVRKTSAEGSRPIDFPLVRVPAVIVSPAPCLRTRRVSCLTTATAAAHPLSSSAGKLA